jgi:hypothetical protein
MCLPLETTLNNLPHNASRPGPTPQPLPACAFESTTRRLTQTRSYVFARQPQGVATNDQNVPRPRPDVNPEPKPTPPTPKPATAKPPRQPPARPRPGETAGTNNARPGKPPTRQAQHHARRAQQGEKTAKLAHRAWAPSWRRLSQTAKLAHRARPQQHVVRMKKRVVPQLRHHA